MWTVDTDPGLQAVFGTLTVLDQPVDADRLVERLGVAMMQVPRLRQRIEQTHIGLGAPRWCDVDSTDPTHRVRRVMLPTPGGFDDLLGFVAAVMADPLDRSQPLWQMWVIEGLADGKSALVVKVHHAITDGMGGLRLWEQFVDTERHPDGPTPNFHTTTGARRDCHDTTSMPDVEEDPDATDDAEGLWWPLAAATETHRHLSDAGRGVADAVASTARHVRNLARNPGRLALTPGTAVRSVAATLDQLVVTDRSRSPLWTQRGGAPAFSVVDADLESTRHAAHRLGGTINDVFVTAVTEAASRYHTTMGAPVDELRMAMPVSLRPRRADTGRAGGGNAFVPTRVVVPTGAVSPAERFASVRHLLSSTRSTPALGMADTLAGVVNLLPASVVTGVVRHQASAVDFTASNVRGAPFALFVAGARMEVTYPIGPLGSTAFNASMLSQDGRVGIGIHADTAAVTDPQMLRDLIDEALQSLTTPHQ